MPAATDFRRAGFTLVELAVVIVIIGLLVGGIVAGRNYVKNAELTTLINESKFYINAFGQFQQKYQYVPGDMPTASNQWPGAHNGDGNGQIISSVAGGAAAMPEFFYAFEHLNLGGMIDGSYTGATTGGLGTLYAKASVNVPKSSFPGAAYMYDHPPFLDGSIVNQAFYFDGLYNHVLRVAGLASPSVDLPAVPILTPPQALMLDLKYDDGRPGTGWILTPKMSTLADCATSNNASAADYNTATTAAAGKIGCYFLMKVQ